MKKSVKTVNQQIDLDITHLAKHLEKLNARYRKLYEQRILQGEK